ncbi:hypothetical protein HC176_15725 [Tamlana crocina]|uniref:Uncharacterized protein n=2 Tax=Tamlana crocina TaxID=393006 RepID=A0ABX1DHY6_9FLAO|nr:hypothetical protein [Tamlana crocina]
MYTENNKYTYADLFFYLTILHNDLNDAIAMDKQALKKRRNALFKQIPLEVVSKKTLLLDEVLITKALNEEINNLYDYDYKIVSKEEIDEAITNRQANTFVMKKVVSAPRPLRRSSAGGVIDGSRHDNGMLKTYQDNITGTTLNAIYFNSFFDTETGKILFFGRPSFKDKKIDVKDFKTIKKAIK